MTLHQLTQSAAFDGEFGLGPLARRALDAVRATGCRWAQARQEADEISRLDHREIADLQTRI
jgi:hypothetical protein